LAFALPYLGIPGAHHIDVAEGLLIVEAPLKLDQAVLFFFCIVELSVIVTPGLFAARARVAPVRRRSASSSRKRGSWSNSCRRRSPPGASEELPAESVLATREVRLRLRRAQLRAT
jgi:hypothetical protein